MPAQDIPQGSALLRARVLAQPTCDLSACAVELEIDGKSYLFGRIGEGFQRLCIEHGFRTHRFRTVFLSGRTDWTNQIGGLPGLLLTLTDQSVDRLAVYGGRNTAWAIASLRRFVVRDGFDVSVTHATRDVVDNDVVVVPVELVKTRPQPANERLVSYISSIVSKMFPTSSSSSASASEIPSNELIRVPDPLTGDAAPSMSYFIQPRPSRGKFDPQKAQQYGVPAGPERRDLTQGKIWTRSDGLVVTPEMLLGAPEAVRRMAFIDVPTLAHFADAKRKNWFARVPKPSEYAAGQQTDVNKFGENVESTAEEDEVYTTRPVYGFAVHYLGAQVDPFSEDYLSFMKTFGSECDVR